MTPKFFRGALDFLVDGPFALVTCFFVNPDEKAPDALAMRHPNLVESHCTRGLLRQ